MSAKSYKSLSDCIHAHNGILPGFDALRLTLAFLVLLFHCFPICYGPGYLWNIDWVRPFGRAVLPMFFCLSGFLVTGSALRLKSLRTFLTFRILRIVPALLVEVTLSAIVLGGILTTLPWQDYYAHPGFWTYFGNIIGHIQLLLPGVFEGNRVQNVNLNLWTLVPEFYCYGIAALLIASAVLYNRKKYLIYFSAFTAALVLADPAQFVWNGANGHGYNVSSIILIYSFLSGALLYLYADYITVRTGIFVALLALGLGCFYYKATTIPAVLAIGYCTVYLGQVDCHKFSLLPRGDYSYGIYLYGYPISQTLWYFFPEIRTAGMLFLAAAVTTIIFAMASWYLIEKPFLRLKKHFPARP